MKGERIIIVGAGIAGLWLAEQLANKGHRVTILEKYDYIGGRILTSKRGYEIGAGRIHQSHGRVRALIRRFGLHTIPLKSESLWMSSHTGSLEPNNFPATWAALLRLYRRLPPTVLATHTLAELTQRALGPVAARKLLDHFPYRAETETLRADVGLRAFGSEMGDDRGFFVVREGLSAITQGLAAAVRHVGVRIHLNTAVTDVTADPKGTWTVHTPADAHHADRVILALHANAIRTLPSVAPHVPALQHLKMEPLTRIYAEYPSMDWLPPLRVITDSPIRYIIPVGGNRVMISYVEGRDTVPWLGLKDARLITAIQKEIHRLFPTAPQPLWMKAYEWTDGCTYWKPGTYSPEELSQQALEPLPRLHCAGESFCVGHQAWIEGALCHAAQLLKRL